MDTLSSQANIAGYRGVLLAAAELPKYFPMLMTAAGMVPPAKVFVVGAAVAGLQAIAPARPLGANVSATDVRPEVKEQIESVGAKYVGIELKESAAAGGGYAKELSEEDQRRQRELLAEQCAAGDVVITTALIGGVFAPKLITGDMVRRMRPGSIIVDLAADGGGNCELSRPGETVVEHGVKIMAPLNLPSALPTHASTLFSRNVTAFLQAFTKDQAFQLDLADDIQQGALITHAGQVVHARTKDALAKAGAKGVGAGWLDGRSPRWARRCWPGRCSWPCRRGPAPRRRARRRTRSSRSTTRPWCSCSCWGRSSGSAWFAACRGCCIRR